MTSCSFVFSTEMRVVNVVVFAVGVVVESNIGMK